MIVMGGFFHPSKTSFFLNKQETDEAGRILILDVTLDVNRYIR